MRTNIQPAPPVAALSDQTYRVLFEQMDEGYCIIQLLYNEHNQPVNWRYYDLNPAFEKNNGLQNAIGKTILELPPPRY